MSEYMKRAWYTVDTVFTNGMALCHKHYDKADAVREYNRTKKRFKNSDGGHVRLSYHVEQVEYIKDEIVLGKENELCTATMK